MKINIKDDQSREKKVSEKLATIKKSEKAGDSKFSEVKRIVISQAITDATNKAPALASSTSNENLFSHFTNPQKAFTPLASTFKIVPFSKDPVKLGCVPKYCQPNVYGQKSTAPQLLQNNFFSNTMNSHKFTSPLQTTEENTTINNFLNNQQSSITVRSSIQNSLVLKTMNSMQSAAGAQKIKDNTAILNNSLNNQQSLTAVRPSMQTNLVTKTMNLPQIAGGAQTMVEDTNILNNLLNNQQSLTTVRPSMQNNLINKTMNLPQTVAGAQPMEENGTFDDLLHVQEPLNTVQPSMQNNSCSNMNLEQFVFAEQSMEENTAEVSMPPVQPSLKNVNSDKSSNIQRFSVSAPSLVQNGPNNLLETQQFSMSTQTEASNTTSSVIKNNKKTLHSQNFPTKGMKRKAEETKNKVKNSENLGNQKKNKKKRRFLEPQISNKFKKSKSKKNFPVLKNCKPLMCAIVEEQYPNMPPLTNVHLGIIRNVIKEKIDNIPFGVFVPKFIHSFIKDGVILVECADNNSKEWLKHAISNYNPEEGVYLKVIPPEVINQYYPASIFVQDEENAVHVLRRMQKQNSDISIRNWQYLSMIIEDSTPGITINLGIPASSLAQLKEKNFKLFHAMDQVSVIMQVRVPF